MTNVSTNITTAAIDAIIQEAYEDYIFLLCVWSSTVLLFYAALLKLGQEVEFIWLKSLGWPALLYGFARYGVLFCVSFRLWLYYSAGRVCTAVHTVESALAIFGLIGVQGLLVVRAYSLTEGNRILCGVFIFLFLSGPILELTENILFDVCSAIQNTSGTQSLLILLINIDVISTDLLVFAVCLWKIWGIWKLSRQAGIRSSRNISSALIEQGILRCCFVVVITVVLAILTYRFPSIDIVHLLNFYQNALSSIMVADFTLDLRRQNSASIEASRISLSSIKFSNILQNIEQSILVEMAAPNPEVERPDAGDDILLVHGNEENIPATFSDIQPESA